MNRLNLLVVLSLVFLAQAMFGCASVAGVAGKHVELLTAADIDTAIQLAKDGEDADGLACWEAIKALAPTGGPVLVKVDGAASAIQSARNVRRGVQAGIDPEIHRKCAVIVVDAEQTAGKLGLRGVSVLK